MKQPLMLDLETTGTYAGCGILSIALVPFSPSFLDYGNFYFKIKPESNTRLGLNPHKETMKWWLQQDAAVYDEAWSGDLEMETVLFQLCDYLTQFKDYEIWANGTDFDISILGAAFRATGIEVPWKYNEVRDYRTLAKTFDWIKRPAFEGAKHNALADARNQAAHCTAILKEIQRCQQISNTFPKSS